MARTSSESLLTCRSSPSWPRRSEIEATNIFIKPRDELRNLSLHTFDRLPNPPNRLNDSGCELGGWVNPATESDQDCTQDVVKRFGYDMAEDLGRLKTISKPNVPQLRSHQLLRGSLGGVETRYRRLSSCQTLLSGSADIVELPSGSFSGLQGASIGSSRFVEFRYLRFESLDRGSI
jgi:hypothetical protein